MSKRRELIESYADWFGAYSWDWWGTLTFPGHPRRSKAIRAFDQWIKVLKKEQGTTEFRWVRVTETGAYGDNLHFHVLIGGLKKQAKSFPGIGRALWEQILERRSPAV